MVGHRPSDWHVLDLDKDPTPGDPQRVRTLAKHLHDFADDVSEGLRLVKGMAGEGTLLEWAGKSADVFKEDFGDVPKNLKKLKKSYEMCGDALADFWPKLERAQSLADKALRKGREARDSLSSAQSRLTSADSWVTRAGKEADKYKDDPTGSKSDADKPDEAKVRAATRDVQHAKSAQSKAQSDVSDAQDALAAAKKMAEDARKMREEAAREAKSKIDEASDAGIQNRSWWEEVGDWFVDNWDTIVAVCKVVVAVLGIVAMIIGGPILGAIVLIAAAVILADTLYKYSKGQASLWDVGLAALDCIPGMKGLTTLGGLAKGLKAFGKTGLKGMASGLRGLKSARGLLANGAKGAYNRLRTVVKGCGDPVDAATGQMFLAQTDIALPGTLPLVFTRRTASDYRTGWWFGPTWSSSVDQRLEIDDQGVVFVTEDGMLLAYPHPEAPGTTVLPDAGPRWPLARLDGGGYCVTDPIAGHSRHFAPAVEGLAVLKRISDRNRNTIDFDYDEDGLPLSIRHSAGYCLRLTVEGGQVTALSLADAREDGSDVTIKAYGYTHGNLTSVVNSSGYPLEFTYDEQFRLTSWTDTNRSRYSYFYDDQDRCIGQGGEAGHVTGVFGYGATDPAWPDCRITTYRTADGAESRFVVNDNSQVIAEIDPLGNTVRSGYDIHHHLVFRTDELGRTTHYTNNELGQPVEVTRPDGAAIRYAYNDCHLPTDVELPDGSTWRQSYDERGNVTSVTDLAGTTTRSVYDDGGRLKAFTDAMGLTTTVRCNAAGLPVEAIDPLGVATRWDRDAFGRPVAVTDRTGHTTYQAWTTEGLPLSRTAPDGSSDYWSYDGEGNCLSYTDALGRTTKFEYTHFDRLAARTDPGGVRYVFTYDASLRLTSVTNAEGREWKYTYDPAGRLVSETDFDGRVLSYTHDAAGQLISRTNGADQTVTFERDALGRITHKNAAGALTAFTYDLRGHLVQAIGPDGELLLRRDEFGQVLAETIDGRTITHAYDELGRRVRRTTPSGATSVWTYDHVGRPLQLDASGRTITFEYDPEGRERAQHLGDSLTIAHAFDELGRRTAQSVTTADGSSVQRRAYTYRADSTLTAVLDQLSGARHYDLDTAGRVTSVRAEQWAEHYAYDEAGNQVEAVWPAGHPGQEATGPREYTGSRIRRAGAVRYEHDAQGRIVLRQKTRLSRKPETWHYTWDAEDRLTAVVTPDGTRWRYRYDPLGRRIAKERLAAEGETVVERVLFAWDGTTLCEQTTEAPDLPNPVTLTWDHRGLRPIAQTDRITTGWNAAKASQEEIDSRFFAIVTDVAGTPSELVDESGDVAWRSRATIWGTTTWPAQSTAYTPLRFPGQYFDPETGLHHNHYRLYDPETARYLSPDPLGLQPAPNPFTYVINPLTWVDPLGLAPCEIALGYQWADLAGFAKSRGLKHFLDLGPDEWRGAVLPAIQDGSVKIHVSMKGFAGGFEGMAKRALKIDESDIIHATEEEMGWIARAVKHGHRDWSSITWYDRNGDVVDVAEPAWDTFGRVRDFIV
ncbi:RHS repeat-associated core domain-containing protein [Streptomyces violarus]|uniref:RHS repeat-associated core domain-containing protein n=1 Tax=Streptomyces violarus TaxID=67380 RepID=UPI0021C22247|nr:RHS repeat-associated core domain-containing protein [Streptomyces violarus]MCT9139725.1 DUF6531 domain-containing protein [Streptomyces violarus]